MDEVRETLQKTAWRYHDLVHFGSVKDVSTMMLSQLVENTRSSCSSHFPETSAKASRVTHLLPLNKQKSR